MESSTVNANSRLPVGVLLSRLGGLSMGRYRKSLKPLELNAQHFVVMKQLETIGTSSQASLADALGLDYSNLATITGELAERGLIERYRHESDKRRYVVELSKSGTELLTEADGAVAEHENRLVESLDDDEREQLQVLLRKVADAAELCPSESDDSCLGKEGSDS